MAKVEIKTKEAKARAALAGGKAKKKKWNKKKVQEKLANAVLFEQKAYDKFNAEVPKVGMGPWGWLCLVSTRESAEPDRSFCAPLLAILSPLLFFLLRPQLKLITPSIVSERLKISGSLARKAIKELVNKGLVKGVSVHSKQGTYTRAIEKETK